MNRRYAKACYGAIAAIWVLSATATHANPVSIPTLRESGASSASVQTTASQQSVLLARVETYLRKINTIKASFVQIAPDGSLANGTFYLMRPGKMRWEYAPPIPVLMIARNGSMVYYDYELDQVSDIPLDDTLAGFLAMNDIHFDPKKLNILEASEASGIIRIHVSVKGQPDQGEMTLEFTNTPLQLRNLILKDAEGRETNVSLSNAVYDVPLDDVLFEFKDPRIHRKRHPR